MSDEYEAAIQGDIQDQTADEISADAPAQSKGAADLLVEKSNPFDSANSDAGGPIKRSGRAIPRAASLKHLAEAVAATKDQSAPDDEFEPVNAPPLKTAAPVARAAPPPADPEPVIEVTRETPPPAPSLDAEVMRLRRDAAAERQAVADERAAIAAERAEFDRSRSTDDMYDEYVDAPSKAFRKWAESIRGEKFASDDEFKSEAADFITLLSGDVMGVPLPENVRIRLEAQNAKKAVKAFKTQGARREAQEVARREQERVDREYQRAADMIGQQFAPGSEAAKSYAWLAAEESPGKLVVEVIQSAFKKDGTQLNWQSASKLANDYLKSQNLAHYDRRKVLLSAPPATAVEAKSGKQDATRESAAGTLQATPKPAAAVETQPAPEKGARWTAENHRRKTREAFRGMKHGE